MHVQATKQLGGKYIQVTIMCPVLFCVVRNYYYMADDATEHMLAQKAHPN